MTTALFLPGTPLLLDGVGGRADPAAPIRALAVAAVARAVARESPDRVLVITSGPRTRDWSDVPDDPGPAVGRLTGRRRGGPETLPLGLAVGTSLLAAAGGRQPTDRWTTDGGEPGPGDGRPPAADLIMVVGDGSALRRSGGPDVADPRALEADDRLRTAVQTGDPRPLAELRAVDAEQLMITGAPVRRWLAGQLTGVHPQAELGYADDPFGVFMIIASWRW